MIDYRKCRYLLTANRITVKVIINKKEPPADESNEIKSNTIDAANKDANVNSHYIISTGQSLFIYI